MWYIFVSAENIFALLSLEQTYNGDITYNDENCIEKKKTKKKKQRR